MNPIPNFADVPLRDDRRAHAAPLADLAAWKEAAGPAAASASAGDASVLHNEHGGFVYSFDEIKKKIIRRNRIAEARVRFAAALDPTPLIKGALL